MKRLALITALALMIGGASALEVQSLQFNPSPVSYNDTPDVTANVDSQDNYIKTVDLHVIRGGDSILQKEMTLNRGSRTGFAQFEEIRAFTVDRNTSYLVRATAYSEDGEISSIKRELIVENGTVRTTTLESEAQEKFSFAGLDIDTGALATIIIAGTLIYAAITWE